MLMEDYAKKFGKLLSKLTSTERATDDVLASFFFKGLRKSLRRAVASEDIAAELNMLEAVADRVEKRIKVKLSPKEKASVKSRKKKNYKGKKSDDLDSENSNSEDDSDEEDNLDLKDEDK